MVHNYENAAAKAASMKEAANKAAVIVKEAKKASKEADKAAKEAAKKAEAKEASAAEKAAAKEAESKASEAAAALAKAEAEAARAADKASKAQEEASAAKKAEREAVKSLTIKAEAVRRGLNAACRALIESAAEASEAERLALVCFVYDTASLPASDKAAADMAAGIKAAEVVAAYRKYSAYMVQDSEGRKQVAKAAAAFSGCNCYTFEPSTTYTIGAIFRTPANNKRRAAKQSTFEAGKYYERTKEGYKAISKAEAAARIKAAKEEAARQAEAQAIAEAQAEADRKAGEALRKAKAAKKGSTKAEGAAA